MLWQCGEYKQGAPEAVHVGVQQHLQEGDEEVEDQPDLDHLHVGGEGQRGRDCVGERQQIEQINLHLLPTNMVERTRRAVRFTVTVASKKKS